MPTVINFDKKKISLMVFTSREDFRQFMQKMDWLYDNGNKYPKLYALADPEAKKDDIEEVQLFVESKIREAQDFEMVKRNLEKGRFPEITAP